MALKQDKSGKWLIESGKDLNAAVAAVEDREAAIEEIEQTMEEEYDYLTVKQEIVDLNEAVRVFMVENDVKNVFRDNYHLTLVRRSSGKWVPEKLKALVPKNIWLKITTPVIDSDKLDDLVRKGEIDRKKIDAAYVETPQKPHVRTYEYKEGQTKEDVMAEEQALRQAMGGSGKPKKRGKKAA